MLSEISWREKDKYWIFSLICECKTNKQTNITKQTQTHRYREQTSGCQRKGRGEGMDEIGEEDSCYAVSVLLHGMIRLTAFMCCCGSVGEMETQSMCPQMEPAWMLFMQTEVIFCSIEVSCVFKCQNDTTCIALKGVKTGCFFGNDFGRWGEHSSISVVWLMPLGSNSAPTFLKSLYSLSSYIILSFEITAVKMGELLCFNWYLNFQRISSVLKKE